MENKIYLLTEDLNFFYKLNKELNRFNIKFDILNIGNKLPSFPSTILTTTKEIKKFEKSVQDNIVFLPYSKDFNFEDYISRVIAAYRVGYRENYSNLTFSIDPGTKHIGLVIFVEDYFFISHTFYEKEKLIKKIENYISYFEIKGPYSSNLIFKFGSGVLALTSELVNNIFSIYKNRENLKVYLIDETKSSKIRIQHEGKRYPKDEASALILALRTGLEVNPNNFLKLFNQIKTKKLKVEELNNEIFEINNGTMLRLKEVAEKVLKGDISLSASVEMLTIR